MCSVSESPHRGDSNEYIQLTIFNIEKKITLILFQETQEEVRNSRGKRTISVRATEGLLYMHNYYLTHFSLASHIWDIVKQRRPR